MRKAEVKAGRGGELRAAPRRAEPMVWLSAAAVVVALGLLLGLLALLAYRGAAHFWPQSIIMLTTTEQAPSAQLGIVLQRQTSRDDSARLLLSLGATDRAVPSLRWVEESGIRQRAYPRDAVAVERRDHAPIYGFIDAIATPGGWEFVAGRDVLEQLAMLEAWWMREGVDAALAGAAGAGGMLRLRLASGQRFSVDAADLTRVYAPNAMTTTAKIGHALGAVRAFLSRTPGGDTVNGGVFPAIVGTVTLVFLMALVVAPLGVLAAIYLQEYAQRGVVTGLVRIAVNNLAGVPSIVYGVFGLGFFVYAVGGSLDELLFADRLPAPTLGTPGMLWAALTMALLTLPVVIVATEEGLARVPASLREGSLALGATRAESLWRVVLPAASPAVLTGLILAVARATGEVAPLLLVGVAKYAPGLPVSTEFPYLHLDRQFMHLGFYIYDAGFQSPNVDTAVPLVFATALLLVAIVLLLNLAAVLLRGRLREAFKAEDLV